MEVVVGVADQLAGLLGRGVGTDGVVDVVGFGEGNLGVVAVNRGTGREDEAPDVLGDRGVEEVDRAVEIDRRVERRVLDAGADARHGRQVHDGIGAVFRTGGQHRRAVADVGLDQVEVGVSAGR